MPVARVGPGAQPVQVADSGEQLVQVAAVGPGAQPVQVAAAGKLVGEAPGGQGGFESVIREGPEGIYQCRSVQVAVGGEQPRQPLGGPVAAVSPGAQPVQVAALGEQPCQLLGGIPVACVGGMPV